MKSGLHCLPCVLGQILKAFADGDVPESRQAPVLFGALDRLKDWDLTDTPPAAASPILNEAMVRVGCPDPFAGIRNSSNQLALSLLPALRQMLDHTEDRLLMAIRLSLAGNVVDVGTLKDFDLEGGIREAVAAPLPQAPYVRFQSLLGSGKRVFIMGDNSGEIVLDRLLVEELRARGMSVTYGVKGGPILNDATMADADQAGIPEVADLVSTGSAWLGVVPGHCSPDYLAALRQSDLIIAKGQANYECLDRLDFHGVAVFMMLKAKCPLVAADLGVETGTLVFREF